MVDVTKIDPTDDDIDVSRATGSGLRGCQGECPVRSVAKTKRTPKRLALGMAIDSSVKNERRA